MTGIFGGSFNPPHKGHLHLAETFKDEIELDRIIILPAGIPPHKEAPDLLSGKDRMEMCRRTFKGENYEISSLEIERQGKSYTVHTLKEIKKKLGNEELFLLVGDDMLLSFHKWKNPYEILSLATVVAGVRDAEKNSAILEEYAENFFPEEYKNGRFKFMEMAPFPVSSTEIREMVKAGKTIDGLVTEETSDYILKRGFYA